ncbi:hypothetical protein [uncultured Rubinisphaera sp.]|uniref:hypothetical protein n=1 Tax=uncultured Rubinisphaera sp. TaxID=1678686 RepID=UPI0030DDC9B9
MSTRIETYLYRNIGVHSVVDLRITAVEIDLTVAPFENLANTFAVRFGCCRLDYIDSSYSDPNDDWTMPWDIIGFDSDPEGDQWKFCLHTDVVEIGFVAEWPVPLEMEPDNNKMHPSREVGRFDMDNFSSSPGDW